MTIISGHQQSVCIAPIVVHSMSLYNVHKINIYMINPATYWDQKWQAEYRINQDKVARFVTSLTRKKLYVSLTTTHVHAHQN